MPFKNYPLKCPKCGSERIQGEGARHEGYLYSCLDCGRFSYNRAVFKKSTIEAKQKAKE